MPARQRTIDFGSDLPPADERRSSGSADPQSSSRGSTPSAAACDSPSAAADEPLDASLPLPAEEALEGASIWVVDAHALIYQVFHAMPDMTSPTGQPVGAIHGFTRDLLDLIEKKKPDYLICAFDHSDQTFRHDVYQQYKEQRESMPEDLRPQIANIFRMLDALGIPRLTAAGYEADDILATLARQAREAGARCYLVTNDKDCWQLVGDLVNVYNIRKDQLLDAQSLQEHWGIRPDQVVDFQSLVGDTVDNVPGVPLIGPKIAGELLRKYDSLEGVFAHAEEVSGTKRRENLLRHQQQALVSRQLVRLVDDVPLELSWRHARVGQANFETAQQLCREFGFRRLADRLAAWSGTVAPETVEQPVDTWQARYTRVSTPAQLAGLVERLEHAGRISVRLQSTVAQPRWAEIEGFAIGTEPGEAFYVELDKDGETRAGALADVLQQLQSVLQNPSIEKWGHDLKHASVLLRAYGVQLESVRFDSMVADYLLAPGERTHELSDLAQRYLGREVSGKRAQAGGAASDDRSVDGWSQRECEAADLPLRLGQLLTERLQEAGLESLFQDVELPLLTVLADMEYHGIRVDVEGLERMSRHFEQQLSQWQEEIHQLAGESFNIDSPRQLAQVLFDRMKLPVVKRTKTGEPSTDAEVLEELAMHHELPAKIVAYRQIAKLKSTYVDALPQLVHPLTRRVHTSFKQDVAATGRLSSKDPNLQNIPIRTEAGRRIRAAFLPAEGWQLLTADYSQIELRILAHFTGDAALLDAFQRDEDIHARVASEVFRVPLDQVASDLRRRAKAVNFGIIYGQTAFGLAKSLGIPKDEAAAFIEAYFATYPGVNGFIEKTLEECRRKGYVSTILGRRRAVQGVRDPQRRRDPRFRTLPERIAINTVIQGSAADLIKLAMISIHRRMKQEHMQARMLLQIHDELVFEVPSEELTYLSRLVADEMTSAAKLEAPLKVDVKCGKNWADCDNAPAT